MVTLELSDERVNLLRETLQAALEEAEEVLSGVLDDKMAEGPDQHLTLFDTQQERLHGLRELLQELEGTK